MAERRTPEIKYMKGFGWAMICYGDNRICWDISEEENDMGVEIKLERKPQKHRAIVSRGILDTIEYEIKEEGKADDILDIVIGIRDTAERIIKLVALQKGE